MPPQDVPGHLSLTSSPADLGIFSRSAPSPCLLIRNGATVLCHWDIDPGLIPAAPSCPQLAVPCGACLLNISSMCFSLPPCAPCPGPGTPCSLSGFTSQLLPGLCPPPWCSEPTMAPQCPQEKAQVLAMARVSQPHGTPLPSGTLCSSYPVSLALSPPSRPHCFPLLCFIACPTTPSPPG